MNFRSSSASARVVVSIFLLILGPMCLFAGKSYPGYFHIISAQTGEVLECKLTVSGDMNLAAGPHVSKPNQEWEIINSGPDGYKLINRAHRLLVDLLDGNPENGASLGVANDSDSPRQNWKIVDHQSGLFSIESEVSGRCLEIKQHLGHSTGQLRQWNFYGGANQLWKVQRIPEVYGGIHYIQNEFVKVGVDADHGGAICWISETDSDRNVVNTKDLGRYIQQSYYAGQKVDRTAEGQSCYYPNFPWNPLQAGDYFGNCSLVMDLIVSGQIMYVKTRPLLWDMNNVYADAVFETWIKLEGSEIIYTAKLTRFESNDLWGLKENFQELPACYLSSDLRNFYSYTGNDIWNYHLNAIPCAELWEDWTTHESWIACVDDSLWGFSVYLPGVPSFRGGYYKGCDDVDTTAYIAPTLDLSLQAEDQFEYRCYFNIGRLNEMMHRIYLRRHHEQQVAAGLISG